MTNTTPLDAVASVKANLLASNRDDITYSPDCQVPVLSARIDATGKLLVALTVYATPEEKAKQAADPAYAPKTVHDFFESQPNAQKRQLPITPFSSGGDTEMRLPIGEFKGNLLLGICKADGIPASSPPAVTSESSGRVTVNAALLKLAVVKYEPGFMDRYEKYPYTEPTDPTLKANSLLVPKAIDAMNATIIPDSKNLSASNEALMNSLRAEALRTFSAGGCAGKLYEAAKAALEKSISDQNGGRKIAINVTGGFETLADSFVHPLQKDKLSTQDGKFIDITATCGAVTALEETPKKGATP
jgi:hypothetical protein